MADINNELALFLLNITYLIDKQNGHIIILPTYSLPIADRIHFKLSCYLSQKKERKIIMEAAKLGIYASDVYYIKYRIINKYGEEEELFDVSYL